MSYGAFSDPYCYPGTGVLKNIPGIRDQDRLEAFETMMTALRAEEPFPPGRLSLLHYRAIHRHLLQDVYSWAGRFRTVRISKGESMFCYPEHIGGQMRILFADLRARAFFRSLPAEAFADSAAGFLATRFIPFATATAGRNLPSSGCWRRRPDILSMHGSSTRPLSWRP